jgi:hypothetical protein
MWDKKRGILRCDVYIRREIKCEAEGHSEKNECEVREEANWHMRGECRSNFVKVLNGMSQAELEQKGESLHTFTVAYVIEGLSDIAREL